MNTQEVLPDPFVATRYSHVVNVQATLTSDLSKWQFPKDERTPFIWNYQMGGFFKSALNFMLFEMHPKINLPEWVDRTNYKRFVDNCLAIRPRKIYFTLPDEKLVTVKHVPKYFCKDCCIGEPPEDPGMEIIPKGPSLSFSVFLTEARWLFPVIQLLSCGEVNGLFPGRKPNGLIKIDSLDFKERE